MQVRLPRTFFRRLTVISAIAVLLYIGYVRFASLTATEFIADHNVFEPTGKIATEKGSINKAPRERRPKSSDERGRFFLAFSFGDQLTRATRSLLTLTAVATYGHRNVVVPFVKDSKFYGSKLSHNTETLSRYFDLKELNRKLDFYGYGLLVSWEHFQKHCQQRLDVLLTFMYSGQNVTIPRRLSYSQRKVLNKKGWSSCSDHHIKATQRIEIRQTICIDPEVLTSFERLESEVLRDSPCVGIAEWRGIGSGRTHFFLPSTIPLPFSIIDEVPINRDLLQIAKEFVSARLGNDFISVHFRSEWILRVNNANASYLFQCLRRLGAKIQETKDKIGVMKIFLATDFTKFGSKSYGVETAKENSMQLQDMLNKILDNPETFDPDAMNISDGGSAAIVEMMILTAGKKLFLVGGGNFEEWMKIKFEKVDSNVSVKICYHKTAPRPRKSKTGF